MSAIERTLRSCRPTAGHVPAGRCGSARWYRVWCRLLVLLVLALPPLLLPLRADAETPQLQGFELMRGEDGLQVAFGLDFDLPRGVEDALHKGVPLYFVARIELFRSRWYWRDRRISIAERTWRLAFQPLTRKFRVSFGGLNQSYDNLSDALVAVSRVSAWRIADAGALEDSGGHYVEFSYWLDTSLLPRPLQIGLGGQADWDVRVEKAFRID